MKRQLSFASLNALVKLANYIQFFGALPDHDELRPFLIEAKDVLRMMLAAIRHRQLPEGLRSATMYLQRFNLDPEQLCLVKERILLQTVTPKQTPQHAFGMYLRWLFEPGHFYQFSLLSNRILFIAENKSCILELKTDRQPTKILKENTVHH